ncbi:MAG: bifunctional aspartate kinase/diaminopimelate decarboxylase, partial [Gammaproteobacteria bacterium]|nr:bifunctional aspartate kinase/diaminopimelate decarboxylase [Gammaproteobacteria bacterium]
EAYFAELRQLAAGIELVGEVSPRVHARVMATGELLATTLGAAWLESRGLAVSWADARELLEARDEPASHERARFLSASCEAGADAALVAQLDRLPGIVLTQGFIARNRDGDTVLLGRGGSDTSAAYLAARLSARRLEIWTDVPGMFSANPRAVPSARLLRALHYFEAQEISSMGSKVLHPRCIPPVRRSGIPLYVFSTEHPEWGGTVISADHGEDSAQLKAISSRAGITLISMETQSMWQEVGFLARAFDRIATAGLSVDLVSTSEANVTVSVDHQANVLDPAVLQALVADLEQICRVRVISDCAAVSLVGRNIRGILHELGPALAVFDEHRIHMLTQAANDLNLTVVVDEDQAHRLVQQLHHLLMRRVGEGAVFGPTWEQLQGIRHAPVVGTEPPWWERRREVLMEIARRESSAYVYDLGQIAQNARGLRGLRHLDAVFFAMKANSNPEVLRCLYAEGLNFECVSPGEIDRVLELFPDLDRRRILFTPNFAPRGEYARALEQGVWVTLDNLHPLRAWPELFADHEVFVRIDPGKGRGHHEHVRTAGAHSKFGVPLFELEELASLAQSAGCRIVGLHAHTGSGILTPENWQQTGALLSELAGRFPHVRYLDLGGGLGVPERPGERPLDLAALDESLAAIREAHPHYALWLEPGRYLVAAAGVLVSEVTQIKGKGDVQYVGIATGMNSLIRPALYGAFHEIVNLTRLGEPATEIVSIVGPNCESGDKLGTDRLMPPSREGDVVLIANAGAYGYVMSSHYNLRQPAREIALPPES